MSESSSAYSTNVSFKQDYSYYWQNRHNEEEYISQPFESVSQFLHVTNFDLGVNSTFFQGHDNRFQFLAWAMAYITYCEFDGPESPNTFILNDNWAVSIYAN